MNRIDLIGELIEKFEYSHEVLGEKFYKGQVEIERLSGVKDDISIIASEVLLSDTYEIGDSVSVIGEIRSRKDNGRLEIYVFPEFLEKTNAPHRNVVVLEGYMA